MPHASPYSYAMMDCSVAIVMCRSAVVEHDDARPEKAHLNGCCSCCMQCNITVGWIDEYDFSEDWIGPSKTINIALLSFSKSAVAMTPFQPRPRLNNPA